MFFKENAKKVCGFSELTEHTCQSLQVLSKQPTEIFLQSELLFIRQRKSSDIKEVIADRERYFVQF